MKPLIFSLFNDTPLFSGIADSDVFDLATFELRQFPDQESYFKFETDVSQRELIFIDSLQQPNTKALPLLFAASTARELGAKKITLCAPYLAYMRQDKRFQPGEAVTSECFAKLLSSHFDRIITIDPHLHRHQDLSEIYAIPSTVLHAHEVIVSWIRDNVAQPVLVGPDSESKQWVKAAADSLQAPYLVLEKTRQGDFAVSINDADFSDYKDYTPVLLDDIISTANTMIASCKLLAKAGLKPAVCIGVHAVFAGDAYDKLANADVDQIVTCNTIKHTSNKIDLTPLIETAL
jgi:ribose-phosphate pyrophosphokinase